MSFEGGGAAPAASGAGAQSSGNGGSAAPGTGGGSGTPAPNIQPKGSMPSPNVHSSWADTPEPASKAEPKSRWDIEEPEADIEQPPERESREEREVKKWKLKVEGQEREMSEEDLLKHASLGLSSQERYNKAKEVEAKAEKTVEWILNELRRDPMKFLSQKELGIDPKALRTQAEQLAWNALKEQMDPEGYAAEQKQLADQAELEEYRQHKQREAQIKEQRAEQEFLSGWDKRIRESFSKQTEVPMSDYTYNLTVQYIEAARNKGYNVGPEDVMKFVKRDYLQSNKSMFSLPPEQLLELMGPDALQKIQDAVIQKHRKGRSSPQSGSTQQTERTPKLKTWEQNEKDALARMRADGLL